MATPFHPQQHLIPLDFETNTPVVPESHAWPECRQQVSFGQGDENNPLTIPTVDLADPNVVKRIGSACEEWGVFQLKGHGVPLGLLQDLELETRRLFSQPMQQKLKALRAGGATTGYGLPKISPFFAKSMWCEGFTIMGSPMEDAMKIFPHDYGRFCDTMEDYQEKMKVLAEEKLLPLILQFLGISKEEMESLCCIRDDRNLGRPSTALQLNSYPSCPEPKRAMGLAPHTDTSLFTIIHQNGGDGLQVYREGVGWIPVAPVARGALVVNVGDFLHVLSNASFLTSLHRAVVNEARHRISVAFFYGLPPYAHAEPFPKLVHPEEFPAQYRPVSVKEYVGLKNKHLYGALALIRKF